jgi:hypothetical protein
MPVVQTYGQRRVGSTPLPGVRRTAAETALSTGAGVERARAGTAQAFGSLAGQVSQIALDTRSQLIERETKRADEVALLDAENRLSTWEQQRLYDPEAGAFAQRGKNALGLPETIAQEYTDLAGEVEASLGTDRQREAFAKLRQRRGLDLDLSIRRHVFQQMQAYEGEELNAAISTSKDAAIANALDPRRVGEELTRAVTAIRTHGPRVGLGPEQIEKQISDVQTAVHVGVIDRLLATDNIRTAEVYFEETKGQISGDALARVEKALEEGGLRKAGQTKADEILAAGGTLTEQREKARAIDDPKLRDEVMGRIEHEANVRDRAEREAEENRLRTAYDLVDRYKDVKAIPPGQWSQLTGSARSALRHYAEALTQGVPIKTDLPTYYGLMQQAANEPDVFARRNLLEFRGKLDEQEFKQLAGLQLSIRSGETKAADKVLNGFRTTNSIVDDTLTLFGVDPNAKATTEEGKSVAQLRRMLDRRVETHANLTGKDPTNEDVQRMLDELLSTSVTVKGSWWNIFPGGKPFNDTTRSILTLTVGDIPAAERKQVEDALRSAGRPVSDATILDLYIETQARLKKGGG